MEFSIKTLNAEKKRLNDIKVMYDIALTKNSRNRIDSEMQELEVAIKILTAKPETTKANLNIGSVMPCLLTDEDEIELKQLLNNCLNSAICQPNRIINPNSNKIAEFVQNWLNYNRA